MPTQTDLDIRTEQSPYAEKHHRANRRDIAFYDRTVDIGALAPLPTINSNTGR